MPNWCSNSVTFSGPAEKIREVRDLIRGSHANMLESEIVSAMAKKMILAGAMGVLKPTQPTEFDYLPSLTATTGSNTAANRAFDELISLVTQGALITPETQQRIRALYQQSGIHNIVWSSIARQQRRVGEELYNKVWLDWGLHHSCEGFWTSVPSCLTVKTDEKIDQDDVSFWFCCAIPQSLAVEINGFNGRLFDGCSSGFTDSTNRLGTKWGSGRSTSVATDELECFAIAFDTACTPPLPVIEALAIRYPELDVEMVYAMQGKGFCGRQIYSQGEESDSEECQLEYSNEEDEDGFNPIVGPEYIMDLPHFGG